jgi:hypothetical protein
MEKEMTMTVVMRAVARCAVLIQRREDSAADGDVDARGKEQKMRLRANEAIMHTPREGRYM